MQTPWIGAAVLAAAALANAGAHAQTPTLYGLIDLAVEHLNHVGGAGRITRMPGLTGALPSRLGLRGGEDLGGGWRLVYTLELGFAPDTGTLNQGGRGFGRQSFVGVVGPWGSWSLGRQPTMLYWSLLEADIIGPSLFGSGSLDSHLPNARADNALAWRGRFGGFDLGLQASLGRDAVNAGPSPGGTNCPGESASDRRACRQGSALLKYDAASWGAAWAIDSFRGGPGAFAGLSASSLSDRRSTLNGWLRQGAWKLGGGVVARHDQGHAATPRSRLWFAGASFALSPQVTLDGQWLQLRYAHSPNQASLLVLRGTYQMSRRTAAYAMAGHIGNQGSLALGVSGGAPGAAPLPGGTQTGLAAGLRTSF